MGRYLGFRLGCGAASPLRSYQHMNDPLSVALREVTETRRLVETLITSSESFDYPKAKLALRDLNRKVRDLAKVEARMQAEFTAREPKIHVLDFAAATPRNQGLGGARPSGV